MNKVIAAVAAFFLFFGLVAISTGAWYEQEQAKLEAECSGTSVTVNSAIDTSATDLTIEGVELGEENVRRAIEIAGYVHDEGLPYKAAEIALITAWQESGFLNPTPAESDRDSAGPFQQRAPWGPLKARMDYYRSTMMFLYGGKLGYSEPGLTDIEDWEHMGSGEAAQAVQVSAYPDAYRGHIEGARLILAHIGWVDPSGGDSAFVSYKCEDKLTIGEQVARAARTMVGEDYGLTNPLTPGVYDGGSMVQKAFADVGIRIPATPGEIATSEGSPDDGASFEWIPISDIRNGTQSLKPGDIVVYGDSADAKRSEATRVGIYVGKGLGEIRVATYNVLGTSHTPNFGPDSGANRIEKAAALIKSRGFSVVGLQELQPNQRTKLMTLLGPDYQIFPDEANYRDVGLDAKPDPSRTPHSVNSIVWDTRVVEKVGKGESLPMPYYFSRHSLRDIPAVTFRHIVSQQMFIVVNTHDPAHKQNEKRRWLDAKQHAQDLERLAARGIPVIMTGDFNSGFGLRSPKTSGNATYQNSFENLTWCVITDSGTMVNAYDAARRPVRSGCSKKTAHEMGVGPVDHIYVTTDVTVSNYSRVDAGGLTGSDHPVIFADISTGLTASKRQDDPLGYYVGARLNGGIIDVLPVSSGNVLGVQRAIATSTDGVLTADGKWMFPLPKGSYTSTGRYGSRIHPVTHVPDFHNGDDWGADEGTKLVAMHDGIVRDIGHGDEAWGNYLRIDYGNGVGSCYAHLSSFSPGLSIDDPVKVGQVVGYVGHTGYATGSHLHLTICTSDDWLYGNAVGTIEPQKFYDQVGLKP